MTDELEPGTPASADAGQPESVAAAVPTPEPLTMERVRAEFPELVKEIEQEAKAAFHAAHPTPAAGTRALINAARVQGADQERTRILSIMSHAESVGREEMAARLAVMPTMNAESASGLLRGMPKALGPAEEFHALMERLGPAPVDQQTEAEAFIARVKELDRQHLAERAQVLARARHTEGR